MQYNYLKNKKYDFIKKDGIDVDKLIKFCKENKGTGVLGFFKNYGCSNLINKPYLDLLMNKIATNSDPKVIEVLMNDDDILELFIKSNNCNYYFFEDFTFVTCKKLLSRFINYNEDTDSVYGLFICFSDEVQEELLYMLKDRKDVLRKLVGQSSFSIVCKIFNDNMLDLVDDGVNLELLFLDAEEYTIDSLKDKYEFGRTDKIYSINPLQITDELCEKVWNGYDIFRIRGIINNANYVTNSCIINDYIKMREDEVIKASLSNDLMPFYQGLYDKLLVQLDINGLATDEDYMAKMIKYRKRLRSVLTSLEEDITNDLKINNDTTKEELYKSIKILNDEALANYIIDYHFEAYYYNVILDLRELVNFYDRGNVELDINHINLYRRILDIDKLSVEDKVKLHLELKKYKMMDIFYDDMLKARRVVNNDIKNRALNHESIKKYRKEELSNRYGVDIYVIKDTELCAIAKSDEKYKSKSVNSYSYSLVGNKVVGTYKPYQIENFIYDASYLNQDQIVHVYPEDSYTIPATYGSSDSSSIRVNSLLTVPELLESDSDYTEILIMEKGIRSIPIDKDIPSLPVLALYCSEYAIPPYMITYAKQKGLGIVYVERTMDERINTGVKTDSSDVEHNYYTGLMTEKYCEERRKRLVR